MLFWRRIVVPVGALLFAAACAGIPKAELTAYTSAYSDVLTVTNGVLDIVSPYERIVIRSSAGSGVTVSGGRRGASLDAPMVEAYAHLQVVEAFAQLQGDPALVAPASGAAAGAGGSAVGQAKEDSTLRAPRTRTTGQAKEDPTLRAPRTRTTGQAKEDPTLRAPRRPAGSVSEDPTLIVGGPGSVSASTIVIPAPCRRRVGGTDPFCYEMRDGYADIGDPPLVAAYRNLSNVVLRFNGLLVAYADGVTGRLLQQELSGLASSVTELSKISPVAGINGAAAFAGSFSALIDGLMPITKFAGAFIDRAELRAFLLANYDIVDEAIGLMARSSVELYGNVAVGTNLFERAGQPGTGQPLRARRKEIRRLISNWTVLLDDVRRLLRDLRVAVENSDGLETRLHTLDAAVIARIDTSAIKKQIANLGAPRLGP